MNILPLPTTRLGKWSAGLNIVFVLIVVLSLILVLGLHVLSFDDKWWDATVPIAFLIEMVALFTGIRAVKKYKDSSLLVILSIVIGVCTILFVPLHSLFISD
jgi:hypothetical protein